MKFAVLPLLLNLLLASTCWATEAFTYEGTLGKLPIVVELTEPDATGKFVGRYFYKSKVMDIPLYGQRAKNGELKLKEEAPCTKELCLDASGNPLEIAPIAAEWSLSGSGKNLSGNWRDLNNGKSFSVSLKMEGKREFPKNFEVGLGDLNPRYKDDALLNLTKYPYDYLKLAPSSFQKGPVVEKGEVAYRIDLDSRIDLAYPTLLKIGVHDVKPINDYLFKERLLTTWRSALYLSTDYLGFGWTVEDSDPNIDKGYEASVALEYISDRLLSYGEEGGCACGGAHPDIYSGHSLIDIRTGKPIVAETLLRNWVAKDFDGNILDPKKVKDPTDVNYVPDNEIIEYVLSHLDSKYENSSDKDCIDPGTLKDFLSAFLLKDDLIFSLEGLPHALYSCTGELARVPIKDAGSLLTDEGKTYFAEFDK